MSYSKGNDFKIEKLNLVLDSGDVISLLDLFVELNIFQDFFVSQSIYGMITISDTFDLYSKLPLKNNETLDIKYFSPDNDIIEKSFRVYSRENVLLGDNGRTTYYTLKFMSKETIENSQIKSSRSYTGKISDIVGAIWSQHFPKSNPIQTQETDGEHTIVLPINNPFSHINFLSKKAASSNNSNDCNFVFYEDFSGWKFVSVASMFQEKPRGYYSWQIRDKQTKRISEGFDAVQSRYVITDLELIGMENYLDEVVNGLYSSYISEHDIKNKKISGIKFEYKDGFKNSTHANTYPLSPDSIISNLDPTVNYKSRFKTMFDNGIYLKRQSQINSLLNKRIRFRTAGNSSINVGDLLKISIDKQCGFGENSDGPKDQYRSGNYIVSSVKHTINKVNGYTMTVEACTDSYANPLPDESRFETK